MTFVDSGAWFALAVPTDVDHSAAVEWFAVNRDLLLTTDFVINETLTLFRARGQSPRALAWGRAVFGGTLGTIHRVSDDQFADAWDVFRTYADKEWSFTDCTSKVVMESMGIATAFSFDQHFRQFGTVTVVP